MTRHEFGPNVLRNRRQPAVITIAVIATLLTDVAHAQRATCEGMEFFRTDSAGHMAILHMARSENGAWSLTHARLDRIGANRAKSLSVENDAIDVVLQDIPGAYRGQISSSGRVIRGEWTSSGARVPMTLQCQPLASEMPDPAPHRTQFVTVAPDVKLEVLDWGGSGRPVILIHGMSATAHD